MSKFLKELLEEHPELNPKNILFYENKENFDEVQIREFWEIIRVIRYTYGCNDFSKVQFPKFENYGYIDEDTPLLKSANFWREGEKLELCDINFQDSVFCDDAHFSFVNFTGKETNFNAIFLNEAIFEETCWKAENALFRGARFMENVDFSNASFECKKTTFFYASFLGEADFTNCIFEGEVVFGNTYFDKSALFRFAKFYGKEKIDFGGVKFKGKENKFNELDFSEHEVDFRESRLQDVNFDKTRFKKLLLDQSYDFDSSFMQVEVNEGDAAAFRILKHFNLEIQNNIKANEYYAREMEAYEKETNSLNDRIVLWVGRTLSDHHQSWLLPILWILFFGSLITFFVTPESVNQEPLIAIAAAFVFLSLDEIRNKYFLMGSIGSFVLAVMVLIDNPILKNLNDLAKHINPLNSFKIDDLYCGNEAPVLFFKILIGFAIYHFIISVRKFSGK